MDKVKIGQFIANCRRDKKLTQEQLAAKLNVSKNAVSKWERGICMMDLSLLKPLSEILNVNVIDILSGEKTDESNMQEKYEESIEHVLKLNEIKSKSFGVYGMIAIFVILIFYKTWNEICFYDILSILCGFNAFKFAYKYTLEKDKRNFIISILSCLVCIFLLIAYIVVTVQER